MGHLRSFDEVSYLAIEDFPRDDIHRMPKEGFRSSKRNPYERFTEQAQYDTDSRVASLWCLCSHPKISDSLSERAATAVHSRQNSVQGQGGETATAAETNNVRDLHVMAVFASVIKLPLCISLRVTHASSLFASRKVYIHTLRPP